MVYLVATIIAILTVVIFSFIRDIDFDIIEFIQEMTIMLAQLFLSLILALLITYGTAQVYKKLVGHNITKEK